MNALSKMAHRIDVNVHVFAARALDEAKARRDAGQGTIEYVGIAVVITVIIAGLVTFFGGDGVTKITDGIGKVISSIFDKTK